MICGLDTSGKSWQNPPMRQADVQRRLRKWIKDAGSMTEVARYLNVNPSTVLRWKTGDRPIPAWLEGLLKHEWSARIAPLV